MKTGRMIATLAACFFIGNGLHAQTWKAKAMADLNKGEFAKVEQTISKLSEEEQSKHAWLIDSLQAMMSRIRDDFRLSREEGKKLLLEKKEYEMLLDIFCENVSPTRQVNYYFDTDDFYMNSKGITYKFRKNR